MMLDYIICLEFRTFNEETFSDGDDVIMNSISRQMDEFINKEEKDKIVTLQVITGGKDGGDNLGPWLLGLEEKTAFLVEEVHAGQNIPRYILLQFYLAKKFDKSVLLLNQGQQEVFVNPHRFCSQFRLHEILYDPKTMPPIVFDEPKEEENAERDRHPTDSPGSEDELGSPA